MQNEPVKQHIVPKVYLSHFTNNQNMINVYDIKEDEFREQSPKTTAVYKNFYTIENLEENLKDNIEIDEYYIENFLNREVEKDYNEIVEKIKENEILNQEDKLYIAKFVTFQHLRTPMFKKSLEYNEENALKKMNELIFRNYNYVKNEIEKLDFDSDLEMNEENIKDIQRMIIEGNYNVKFPKNHYLGFMLNFSETMVNILLNQKWYILISPSKSGFLTSDHPFAMIKFENQPHWAGYGLINTEKTIPLTPNICLFMGGYGNKIIRLKIDRKKVRNINFRTINSANRFVISNNMGLLKGMINKAKKQIKKET